MAKKKSSASNDRVNKRIRARDKETMRVRIPSADRTRFLKAPKLH